MTSRQNQQFDAETYPKKILSGSTEVTVGSGVNIKLPLGPVGVKPSNEMVTSVVPFAILFLLVTHGTLLSVTL